jgi:radical SAM-linked protein
MSDFTMRVTYAETGRLMMLSHLEVTRALERTVRRAGLPYAVTNGFSPHMRLSFGAALPVGVGGLAEVFDVVLTEFVAPQQALALLRQASPADLMPQAVRYVTRDEKAASVAYPFCAYRVEFSAPVVRDGRPLLSVPEQITVVRKKKEKHLEPADFLVGRVRFGNVGDSGSGIGDVEAVAPTGVEGSTAVRDAEAVVPAGVRGVAGPDGTPDAYTAGARGWMTCALESKPTGSLRIDVLVQAMCDAAGAAGQAIRPVSVMRTAQAQDAASLGELAALATESGHGSGRF